MKACALSKWRLYKTHYDFMLFDHGGAVYWFPVCRGSGGVLEGLEGEQMSSHMEEPRRNAAHLGGGGEILISAFDYSRMKVRVINNSAALCIISQCTKEELWSSDTQFNVCYP